MTSWLDLREQARQHRPALPALHGLQAAAIATWRGRMVNEYQSSHVFAALAERAQALSLGVERVEALRAFEAEERRHGVLCGAVVEALGGEARAEVEEPRPVPRHGSVGALEGFLRNVLSVSCLSETVAVALIGAERLEMPEGALHELLTRIWADEVGHARFGWRLLGELAGSLSVPERARLSMYLRVAFAHLESHELSHLPATSRPPPEGAALGLCSGADARVLFYETVERAIIPQLETLGFAARSAWHARQAPAALASAPHGATIA